MDDTIYPQSSSPSTSSTEALKAKARTLTDDARKLGELGKEAAAEQIHRVRARGEEALDTTLDQAKDFERTLAQSVRERPLRSLAYALGAGFVAGLIFRR